MSVWENKNGDPRWWVTALGLTIVSLIVFGIFMGVFFGFKSFQRYQKVQDTKNFVKTSQMKANNQTVLNEIQISQTKQLIEVENQKAAIRVAEAKGIASAQDIINRSLTPLYLQHEAIQAQKSLANSTNHTTIYIPTGDNGIPLVVPAKQ